MSYPNTIIVLLVIVTEFSQYEACKCYRNWPME